MRIKLDRGSNLLVTGLLLVTVLGLAAVRLAGGYHSKGQSLVITDVSVSGDVASFAPGPPLPSVSSVSWDWDYRVWVPCTSTRTADCVVGFGVFEKDIKGENPTPWVTVPNPASPSTTGLTTVTSPYSQKFTGWGMFLVCVQSRYKNSSGADAQSPSACITVNNGPPAPLNLGVS